MELVTIAVAARRMGLSRASVRRRLASGELTGQQVARPQGTVWLVEFPAAGAAGGETSRDVTAAETPHDVPRDVPQAPSRPTDQAPASPQASILAQRAEDMAVYSHRLLEPYVEQIAAQAERIGAQAERIGHLELELEHAKVRLRAELDMAKAGDRESDPRPWWRRLWG